MTKVRMVTSGHPRDLESKINELLDNPHLDIAKVVDIKYTVDVFENGESVSCSAMIIYEDR